MEAFSRRGDSRQRCHIKLIALALRFVIWIIFFVIDGQPGLYTVRMMNLVGRTLGLNGCIVVNVTNLCNP